MLTKGKGCGLTAAVRDDFGKVRPQLVCRAPPIKVDDPSFREGALRSDKKAYGERSAKSAVLIFRQINVRSPESPRRLTPRQLGARRTVLSEPSSVSFSA